MKTVVINTSKEAKNTKLDILFKAPFDRNSLLWIDSELQALGEVASRLKQTLTEETDTVDRDYQLVVLVDLYEFPLGNDKSAIPIYQRLLEKYIRFYLVKPLSSDFSLEPRGVCVYFVDSAKAERTLNFSELEKNYKEQEVRQYQIAKQREEACRQDRKGDLCDDLSDEVRAEPVVKEALQKVRTEADQILMEIFGWKEDMTAADFKWEMAATVSADRYLDFTQVFGPTAVSISNSSQTASVLDIALGEVLSLSVITGATPEGRFPVYTVMCPVVRDNEQSKIEGFFCLFANVFTCVQEEKLSPRLLEFSREQIAKLLIDALKKYKHFSKEENIQIAFEPIGKVFDKRETICKRRKEAARKDSKFGTKSAEEVAEIVMSERSHRKTNHVRKLRGLDRTFHQISEDILANYDPEVIEQQNNLIVKNCLEGLWRWRDSQTAESFKILVNKEMQTSAATATEDRDNMDFIEEEYEKARDELINLVTDAECKLAGNKNILLDAKDILLKYGDWMRKGRRSLVSCIGAIFTVFATVVPFAYNQFGSGNDGIGDGMFLLLTIAGLAFLYATATSIYMTYVNRKKIGLINELENLRKKSEEDRKASIMALYRYYNETVVDAETHYLLWRELLRRDRDNAKRGTKRNYHIKRLKSLAEQVDRFITMMKLDVGQDVEANSDDLQVYEHQGLRINGEESYYHPTNRRVYCLLPEKNSDNHAQEGGADNA